ncbi:MAG: hydroxymethylglutaryl-CoA lyase [Gammaproteobacteria bacterium]|nr:hydroxymethylglutaryl-CoA lyase [Gammaproteobacteria bacterium]
MNLPKQVTLVEVGPRDGLQNEASTIPTKTKIEFINQLSQSGLKVIEATSFVSPKWVPQMADHSKVMQGIERINGVRYPVLIPNQKGFEAALETGIKDIAVFAAASQSFSQKNTNCSIKESLARLKTVIELAKKNKINVRGYVSCILGCPYEGEVDINAVVDVSQTLFEMGCYEISLGDTIGAGTPAKTKQLITAITKKIPLENLAVHFHNTYGQALANIYASLECGINTIDASIAGLGGCPYARGASGNVATEDVLYMLNGLGIQTGVDLNRLIEIDQFIMQKLKRPTRSNVAEAMLAK